MATAPTKINQQKKTGIANVTLEMPVTVNGPLSPRLGN